MQAITDQVFSTEGPALSTHSLIEDDHEGKETPLYLTPIYAAIMTLIVLGNGVFFLSFLTTGASLTVTSIFLCSLATADFLVGVLVIPTTIHGLAADIHSGVIQCSLLPYCQLLSVSASIGSLLCICVDRYRVIVRQRAPWKPRDAAKIVIGIWLAAGIYSTRHFVQQSIRRSHEDEDEEEVCGMFIEDDLSDLWFRLVDFIVLFCVPMVAMVVQYRAIILLLWAPNSAASESSVARKRKVVILCLAVVISFSVCWLPWHLTDLIADSIEMANRGKHGEEEEEDEDEDPVSMQVQIFTTILPLANSFASPILYVIFNAGYRQNMLAVVTCMRSSDKKGNKVNSQSTKSTAA